MLMIGISGGHNFVTILTRVRGQVLEMFVFNVVLESCEATTALDQSALGALVRSTAQFGNPSPYHVADGFREICRKNQYQ